MRKFISRRTVRLSVKIKCPCGRTFTLRHGQSHRCSCGRLYKA